MADNTLDFVKEAKSSMRKMFIRVSLKNDTKSGPINYTYADVKKMVDEFCKKYEGIKYAMIFHDRDVDDEGNSKNAHVHIFIRSINGIPFARIKKYFPYGDIESVRNSNACVQYLIHKNHPNKTQYSVSDIHTNFSENELTELLQYKSYGGAVELNTLLEKIALGEIKEYNLSNHCDVALYSKYRSKIKAAFEFRNLILMNNPNRSLNVLFFTGSSGTGKTTIAKKYSASIGDGSFFVSGSSRDPMQGYRGENTLILDDLRDDSFAFADILKLLDPFTSSAVSSRYSDKIFTGSTIIITSYTPIACWYSFLEFSEKKQLYRRINEVWSFNSFNIFKKKFNGSEFVDFDSIPNPLNDLIK